MRNKIFILFLAVLQLFRHTGGHSTQLWRKFAGKIANVSDCNNDITLQITSCTGNNGCENNGLNRCPDLATVVTRGALQDSTTVQIRNELGCVDDPRDYNCNKGTNEDDDDWPKGDQKACLMKYCALICDQDDACVGFNFNNRIGNVTNGCEFIGWPVSNGFSTPASTSPALNGGATQNFPCTLMDGALNRHELFVKEEWCRVDGWECSNKVDGSQLDIGGNSGAFGQGGNDESTLRWNDHDGNQITSATIELMYVPQFDEWSDDPSAFSNGEWVSHHSHCNCTDSSLMHPSWTCDGYGAIHNQGSPHLENSQEADQHDGQLYSCDRPTSTPTPNPTSAPTPTPTSEPTPLPTSEPTPEPTNVPTAPTFPTPTSNPTPNPTSQPTSEPTHAPTSTPTLAPVAISGFCCRKSGVIPTHAPTPAPTPIPTPQPTVEVPTYVLPSDTNSFNGLKFGFNQELHDQWVFGSNDWWDGNRRTLTAGLLPFDDPAKLKIQEVMRPTASRYPGGTPANFFDMRTGQYVIENLLASEFCPESVMALRSNSVTLPLPFGGDQNEDNNGDDMQPDKNTCPSDASHTFNLAGVSTDQSCGFNNQRCQGILSSELYCSRQRNLWKYGKPSLSPPQESMWSVDKWLNGFVEGNQNAGVPPQDTIYDLNLFSMNAQENIELLQQLNASSVPVKYIEMGNEYYLYDGGSFADGGHPIRHNCDNSFYMNQVNIIATEARQLFPGVKIAVQSHGYSSSWDVNKIRAWLNAEQCYVSGVAQEPGCPDAFTYHDYSATGAIDSAFGFGVAGSGEPSSGNPKNYLDHVTTDLIDEYWSKYPGMNASLSNGQRSENVKVWITEVQIKPNGGLLSGTTSNNNANSDKFFGSAAFVVATSMAYMRHTDKIEFVLWHEMYKQFTEGTTDRTDYPEYNPTGTNGPVTFFLTSMNENDVSGMVFTPQALFYSVVMYAISDKDFPFSTDSNDPHFDKWNNVGNQGSFSRHSCQQAIALASHGAQGGTAIASNVKMLVVGKKCDSETKRRLGNGPGGTLHIWTIGNNGGDTWGLMGGTQTSRERPNIFANKPSNFDVSNCDDFLFLCSENWPNYVKIDNPAANHAVDSSRGYFIAMWEKEFGNGRRLRARRLNDGTIGGTTIDINDFINLNSDSALCSGGTCKFNGGVCPPIESTRTCDAGNNAHNSMFNNAQMHA